MGSDNALQPIQHQGIFEAIVFIVNQTLFNKFY